MPPPLPTPPLLDAVVADTLATLPEKSVYVGQDVPPKVLDGVARSYGEVLAPDEGLYAVYDSTVRGNGENGFVVTSTRTVGRELWSKPFHFAHADVRGAEAVDAKVVVSVARGAVRDRVEMLVHEAVVREMFVHFYDALARAHGPAAPGGAGLSLHEAMARIRKAALDGELDDDACWALFDAVMVARARRPA